MRTLKLQVQMSIDGFIAGPNGGMDWLVGTIPSGGFSPTSLSCGIVALVYERQQSIGPKHVR